MLILHENIHIYIQRVVLYWKTILRNQIRKGRGFLQFTNGPRLSFPYMSSFSTWLLRNMQMQAMWNQVVVNSISFFILFFQKGPVCIFIHQFIQLIGFGKFDFQQPSWGGQKRNQTQHKANSIECSVMFTHQLRLEFRFDLFPYINLY